MFWRWHEREIMSIYMVNLPPRDGIIGMHFIRLSFRPSVCTNICNTCPHYITYLGIDVLPHYLVKMLSSLRRYAVTLSRVHTSKVKVTQYIYMSEYTWPYLRYNLLMHWRFSERYSRPLHCLGQFATCIPRFTQCKVILLSNISHQT